MTPPSIQDARGDHPAVFEDLNVDFRNTAKLPAFPHTAVFRVESSDAEGTCQPEEKPTQSENAESDQEPHSGRKVNCGS